MEDQLLIADNPQDAEKTKGDLRLQQKMLEEMCRYLGDRTERMSVYISAGKVRLSKVVLKYRKEGKKTVPEKVFEYYEGALCSNVGKLGNLEVAGLDSTLCRCSDCLSLDPSGVRWVEMEHLPTPEKLKQQLTFTPGGASISADDCRSWKEFEKNWLLDF